MTNIRICARQDASAGGRDIRICAEQDAENSGEIRICPEEETDDPCGSPPVLELSGDDDCSVGDTYTATGGVAPYIFSFDGGSIDSNGAVTSIPPCGGYGSKRWATVTVTDYCGATATLDVRLPGGEWQEIEGGSVNSSNCHDGQGCKVEATVGGIKRDEWYTCCKIEYADVGTPQLSACAPGGCDAEYHFVRYFAYHVYEWKCP